MNTASPGRGPHTVRTRPAGRSTAMANGLDGAVVAVLVAIVPSGDDEPAPAPSRTTTAPPVP